MEKEEIGIWKIAVENGDACYVRDPEKRAEWVHWANNHKIHRKGERKRIVLLGESVARGFLYAPFYTVALELEAILGAMPEMASAEVLDLSRVNLQMDELAELIRSCPSLAPDAVIIFAGNNWHTALLNSLQTEDYEQLFAQFRERQFEGVKKYVEDRFRALVIGLLEEMHHIFCAAGIPVIFIVPEFNLADWRSDDIERSLSRAPGGRIEEWIKARDRAEEYLGRRDGVGLAAEAGRMVELDPSNPLGFELLGEAHRLNGAWDKARSAFEAARDTVLFVRGNNSKPRCFGIIRQTLLAEGQPLGIRVIDLPAIFQGLDASRVPGMELFLDYCHLTVEGIKIAMRYAARELLQVMTGSEIAMADIPYSSLQPGERVKSVAHFFSAIHNAHYGQPPAILTYHCRQAVVYSDAIRELMLQYIDFSTRQCNTLLCRSFEQIMLDSSAEQYSGGMALKHPRDQKLLDVELVQAMVEAIGATGTDAGNAVQRLLIKEHAIGEREKSLLQSQYCLASYNAFALNPQPGYFQARSMQSRFSFVSDGEGVLRFRLVYRTPGKGSGDQRIIVRINGSAAAIGEMPLVDSWARYSFSIDARLIHTGLNRLTIDWPYPHVPMAGPERLTGNSFLDMLFPVLGEIWSFTAIRSQADA